MSTNSGIRSFQSGLSRTVKSISVNYEASSELSSLFEDFRLMCNDAIRIAVETEPRSRFNLIQLAYSRLKEYGLHSHYILSACEVAYSHYRNKNRKSIPYVRKAFLRLDNQSYRLNHLLLRIPTTSHKFIFLTLQCGDYHLSLIDDPNLKRGSVTVTSHNVAIAFSKVISIANPLGFVGVDINERNVTISATCGHERRFAELREVAEIKERYREIRAKIGRMRKDNRIGKALLNRYGRRERSRSTQRIHNISKQIVDYARERGFGLKMEKLTGIRRLFKRGNGQGSSFRGRMNSWSFGEIQRQIDYKAAWHGVPVYYVNPRGTSSNCPDCGSHVTQLKNRKLYCLVCKKFWDRDDLASKNIMACAVPQARPTKGSREKESRAPEDAGNPSSRWGEVGLVAGNSRQVNRINKFVRP
ncbi:MAG TPA: transposase [Candidatus Bathyarchaeia archaeon]|nr:transposase [Candidatus Bathyarchaeia archaeon]